MKEVKDMTQSELMEYFLTKKSKGASFRELAAIFEKNDISDDTRRMIMSKLDELDKVQKIAQNKEDKTNMRRNGFVSMIIGLLVIAFGFAMFFATAKKGIVFYFNFAVWIFGAVYLFRGILNIISGSLKNN